MPSRIHEPTPDHRCTFSLTRRQRSCYRFLYLIKPRLRSAPPGALPGSAPGAAPAFGPLRPGCADARPHVVQAGDHESRTAGARQRSKTCLRRGRSGSEMAGAPSASAGRSSGVRGELPSRLPSTQAEPSRRGSWRPGRSYSGALHLDARSHARSTVCGSTADGMVAGVSGGLWEGCRPRHLFSERGCHD